MGLSRQNPVPRGQPLTIPEGWEVTVIDFNGDAWTVVQAENMFNDPPEPGYRMVIIRVRLKNVSSDDPDTFSDGDLQLVGTANVGYSTYERSCGVVPDSLGYEDVFRGGVIEGNVCYQVEEAETGLVLYTDVMFDDEDRRWFAVK